MLAERLRSGDYQTRAYSANALVGPELEFGCGFDEYNLRWDLSGSLPELFPWREALEDDPAVREYARAVVSCLLDRDLSTVPSLRRALEVYSYDDEGATEVMSSLRRSEFGDREFPVSEPDRGALAVLRQFGLSDVR